MPFCTYCGQSFTRDEHLERHILTHTNVKPFKCFTCHMSFARRDLLHRHYTVHGKDENQMPLNFSQGIVPRSAGRTPIACTNCAKTKTKCDRKFPCSRCAQRGLKCEIRATRRITKSGTRFLQEQAEALSRRREDVFSSTGTSMSTTSDLRSSGDTFSDDQAVNGDSGSSSNDRTPSAVSPLTPSSQEYEYDMEQSTEEPFIRDKIYMEPYDADLHQGAYTERLDTSDSVSLHDTWAQFAEFDLLNTKFAANEADQSEFAFAWHPMNIHPEMQQQTNDLDPNLLDAEVCSHKITQPCCTAGVTGDESLLSQSHSEAFHDNSESSYLGAISPDFQHSTASVGPLESTHEEWVLTQGQWAWPAYRCEPSKPTSECPRTGMVHLNGLIEALQDYDAWDNCMPADVSSEVADNYLHVDSLREISRDKLLAATQSFLRKALGTHDDDNSTQQHDTVSSSLNTSSEYVILPPARILRELVQIYANTFEQFYPLTPTKSLDLNRLIASSNVKASCLLTLLMCAQAAHVMPSLGSRWLSGGLIEACRTSLLEIIQRTFLSASDYYTVLHAAFLFTASAGWSGDKWHMDIAMSQRGMYIAMVRQSGFLDLQRRDTASFSQERDIADSWADWLDLERRSRFLYAWVMLDHDLSLFHDVQPLFSVTELGSSPMPDRDALWSAKSAQEWSERTKSVSHSYCDVIARPLSLLDLFRLFIDDKISLPAANLTALQLRLLLHPLHATVGQYRRLVDCFPDAATTRDGDSPGSSASTYLRFDEVQALLQLWSTAADQYLHINRTCSLMQAALISFHLISLNAVASIPMIERIARREGSFKKDNKRNTHRSPYPRRRQCITAVPTAVFHSGQVLRLMHTLPKSTRPPWWAAAIYRVALVLWRTASLSQEAENQPNLTYTNRQVSVLAVDRALPDQSLLQEYRGGNEAIVPSLTRRNGSPLFLNHPQSVLRHCVEILDEGVSTRFSNGIGEKLTRLAQRWDE